MRKIRTSTTGLRARHRGVVLIVALIMLVLLSLIVVSAFNLTSSNLKSVGNVQVRDEAIAAGNKVTEQQISTTFYNAITTQTFTVDINRDGTDDYSVVVAPPTCIRAVQTSEESPSEVGMALGMSTGSFYNTDWDIKTKVTDPVSGASVVIRQGVRVYLSSANKATYCP